VINARECDEKTDMKDQQSSYRQIMKTTSLFGGVQIFQILIQIIKSKLVAVLLGTTGMGISSLLTSTTGFIASITSFGLGTSGTKSIAEAYGKGDENHIALIVSVLRKCIWVTGLLGMAITLILSPWLSQLTFGNKDYTLAFIWLSLTSILDQLSTGQLVVIRGLRKYKYLAKASLIGSLFGLLLSLPLYYFWGVDGVVPAIMGTSVLNLLLSWYFVSKVKIEKVSLPREITFPEGKIMLKMGFAISLSGIVGIGASYIIRVFISNYGGIEQVGLYSAGFTLLNSYVGLIFSAMAADYFPRLSSHANDNIYCQKTINEQADISFLLLTPFLLIFLIFCPIIIKILFTNQFMSIDKMLYWAILGMLFRAASWSISFVFIAKGDVKIFFFNEFFASIYILILNVAGYYFLGLTGIGIAFVLGYIFYFIHMTMLSIILYKIKLNQNAIKLLIIQIILTVIAFTIGIYIESFWRYFWGIPTILIGITYSYINLDKRIQLSLYVSNYIKSKQK
jgi:O-antigen/teichoic acid export membrane protein